MREREDLRLTEATINKYGIVAGSQYVSAIDRTDHLSFRTQRDRMENSKQCMPLRVCSLSPKHLLIIYSFLLSYLAATNITDNYSCKS